MGYTFENSISGPKDEDVIGNWRKCHMRASLFFNIYETLLGRFNGGN
jgi:hypothetical protein